MESEDWTCKHISQTVSSLHLTPALSFPSSCLSYLLLLGTGCVMSSAKPSQRCSTMHHYLQHQPTAQRAFYESVIFQCVKKGQKAVYFYVVVALQVTDYFVFKVTSFCTQCWAPGRTEPCVNQPQPTGIRDNTLCLKFRIENRIFNSSLSKPFLPKSSYLYIFSKTCILNNWVRQGIVSSVQHY